MIRLQCQSQSLLNAMVLASLTTFHTATIVGIRVWKEYNIGEARFIEWSEFNLPRKISNHQLYKGKGLNKVRSSTSSVSIWESSVATKSMLIMSQSMRKARNIDGFLMFDATKSQVFK